MSTLNLLPFIATQNALAKREERLPVFIYSDANKLEIPESLNTWFNKIEDYLNGMRLFGQETGRKEDGYGERTYHWKDLEDFINILRSIGLSKTYPDFMQDFPTEQGWSFPEMKTEIIKAGALGNEEGHDIHVREVFLDGLSFDQIYVGIKEGKYSGLDCVDYSGIIHRNCQLLKISDLHPSSTKAEKAFNPVSEKFENKTIQVAGVNSDLYLIVTPKCQAEGWEKIEGEDEPSLKSSPLLRSPLGFVTMRLSRLGDIPTRFPKGTGLLKSLCPVNVDYHTFDSVIGKATLVIQDPRIPGVIYKALAHANNQAFLTDEHLAAQQATLDYILSEKEDGLANVYKNWMLMTGQHYLFSMLTEEVNTIFNARPKVIDDSGARAGQDLQYGLMRVVDIQFNFRWAIVEEFEAILNPRGSQDGKSSVTCANPKPHYIHVLNPETKEWEKVPMNKYLLAISAGKRYFVRGEDPFTMVDVNALENPELKPLTDIYERVKRSQEEAVASLKKD